VSYLSRNGADVLGLGGRWVGVRRELAVAPRSALGLAVAPCNKKLKSKTQKDTSRATDSEIRTGWGQRA